MINHNISIKVNKKEGFVLCNITIIYSEIKIKSNEINNYIIDNQACMV